MYKLKKIRLNSIKQNKICFNQSGKCIRNLFSFYHSPRQNSACHKIWVLNSYNYYNN